MLIIYTSQSELVETVHNFDIERCILEYGL
nr:MAG TPA: hypothetical protein [Crassvirales sp.]